MANSKEKASTETQFAQMLRRSNGELQKDRADRLAKVTSHAAQAKLNRIDQDIMKVEDKLEHMLEISASDDINSASRIENWDAEAWVEQRIQLKEKKRLLEIRREILAADVKELF
jgi:hypothetical protein